MLTSALRQSRMLLFGLFLSAGMANGQNPHDHMHQSTETTVSAASAETRTTTTLETDLPTAHFRGTHKEELQHLDNVEKWSGELRNQSPPEQKITAGKILNYFRNRLIPHAEWEEGHLYPLIDKLTDSNKNPYTATMRHEHKIVGRWIEELEAEAAKSTPDYKRFARKSDMLTGLVRAHFELEDEILLPHVDKSMTREDFEKAVGDHQ